MTFLFLEQNQKELMKGIPLLLYHFYIVDSQ